MGEDFTKSLIALRTDLEASCEMLMSDIARTMDLHPDDPVSRQVKAALQKWPAIGQPPLRMLSEGQREEISTLMAGHEYRGGSRAPFGL